jgi:hypothetical protein
MDFSRWPFGESNDRNLRSDRVSLLSLEARRMLDCALLLVTAFN